MAKSIAKYPQASLLFDREATIRSTYGVPASNCDEQFSKAIREEIQQGIEVFKTSEFSLLGSFICRYKHCLIAPQVAVEPAKRKTQSGTKWQRGK